MPHIDSDISFQTSILSICELHGFSKEEIAKQQKILERERVFNVQMLQRMDGKRLIKVSLINIALNTRRAYIL